MTLYDQIAACANTGVCNSVLTGQVYSRDIRALFENWHGYIVARRTLPSRNRLRLSDRTVPRSTSRGVPPEAAALLRALLRNQHVLCAERPPTADGVALGVC